jgi:hypothetical protein
LFCGRVEVGSDAYLEKGWLLVSVSS